MSKVETALLDPPARVRPRIGFLGVGWIGLNRMKAVVAAGAVDVAAVADPAPQMAAEAAKLATGAELLSSLDEILDHGVDGVVIATPSALHAQQAIRALARGVAVFCQKPLGRTEAEVREVIAAAHAANRLLAVDMSYRFTQAMRRIRALVRAGELGRIYAADLVFHNAYGPDKAWFYDQASSGGGCLMDLGVHLVDLALWALDSPITRVTGAALFAGGEPLGARPARVEDYAAATLAFETGAIARVACSWRLQAGCDAVISAAFYGTDGGATLRNVNGSFYDFVAERYRGTARETLASPPDAWGGRAAAEWASRLASGERFDPAVDELIAVHRIVDQIYGR
jgi:predicted dehydrogenase